MLSCMSFCYVSLCRVSLHHNHRFWIATWRLENNTNSMNIVNQHIDSIMLQFFSSCVSSCHVSLYSVMTPQRQALTSNLTLGKMALSIIIWILPLSIVTAQLYNYLILCVVLPCVIIQSVMTSQPQGLTSNPTLTKITLSITVWISTFSIAQHTEFWVPWHTA